MSVTLAVLGLLFLSMLLSSRVRREDEQLPIKGCEFKQWGDTLGGGR